MVIADRLEEVHDYLRCFRRLTWRESRKEEVEDNSTWLIEDDLGLAAEVIEPLHRPLLASPCVHLLRRPRVKLLDVLQPRLIQQLYHLSVGQCRTGAHGAAPQGELPQTEIT